MYKFVFFIEGFMNIVLLSLTSARLHIIEVVEKSWSVLRDYLVERAFITCFCIGIITLLLLLIHFEGI